ncbi:dipeptidase [Adhaeribacter radiodurans]|uniref:Membrane dipeptidase n=1 Tax=Adhaeribacter radiodurans TaxID=2745197 RepID=A0A7L7L4E2_9BACT|nr:dipeptidase [Adhaeribacter radiodurans]QMU27666.1 membrane dipeptidase [Adhaeribacter radiodurans]
MKYFLLLFLLLILVNPGKAQDFQKWHEKAILVDTHNDVLYGAIMEGMPIEKDLTGKAHTDLKRLQKGGVDAQVFAVWCDETYGKNTAFKYANTEIDSLEAIAQRNPDKMVFVNTPSDLRKVVKHKKLAAMIGVEGGHMIEDNITYLDSLFHRGVCYLTLTWNNSTSWATSSRDESTGKIPNPQKGLNDFGRKIVKHMNELGMLIDVSHVGEQTFYDVIQTTTKPIIASHSSVYAICPHHRNLKDNQIKAIAKNKGVIQVNFASDFIDPDYDKRTKIFLDAHKPELDSLEKISGIDVASYFTKKYPTETYALRPPLSLLLDHIDYIVKLVGVNHVGLGSDFDGISSSPKDIEDVSQFPNITKGLVERGYRKRDIQKILGGNFIRAWEANQP